MMTSETVRLLRAAAERSLATVLQIAKDVAA